MKKKFISLILFILVFSSLQAQSNKTKFIKGNINDKTQAVKQSNGAEAEWLAYKAIDFALENKELLGNDRDLEGLVVAAVLSFTPENLSSNSGEKLSELLINVFTTFEDSNTVLISVVSKFLSLHKEIPTDQFSLVLTDYINSVNPSTVDKSAFKAVLNATAFFGNSETFSILFNFLNSNKYEAFYKEIEDSVSALIPVALNETIDIINNGSKDQLFTIFNICKKNSKISKNNLCEIAENVLNKTILLVEDFSKIDSKVIDIQLESLKILSDNKWTRASSIGLTYFNFAKKLFNLNQITEAQFSEVISSLSSIAPIDSISPLISYLEELNSQKEDGSDVNSEVVLSVIKTLGAIGDKTAFDTLLAVTYINYPENVLSAARDALAGLRW